jgi:eukaryotic-like serine/threonine-protein kinase
MDADSKGRKLMQGPVVLPEDVQIVPLTDLPEPIRAQLDGANGDFALTRPHSRTPSKVIDANAAALLEQFRGPKTIVDAILAYSKNAQQRPSDVLEEAYPLIESCLLARLLVEPGADSEKIEPCFAPGDRIAGNTVIRPVQALIDSEVYQVTTADDRTAALKIARPNAGGTINRLLSNEANLLRCAAGAPAPALFETGELNDGRGYVVIEWFEGDDALTVAQKLAASGESDPTHRVAELCATILDAYAALHERGVIHGDVHPGNILVSATGEARIIDFGVGHAIDSDAHPAPRAGVPFFFDPEYAHAARAAMHPPAATLAGEQYSLGALVYSLLCGQYYLDFSFDKQELLRQIVEEPPVPFARRGADAVQTVEPVVLQALNKDPFRRFKDTRDFAQAFRHALANMQTASLFKELTGAPVSRDVESRQLLDRVLAILDDPHHKLEYQGPASPTTSLTYGSAGVAYAAYRIACAHEDARLLALADAWAERAALEKGEKAFYSAEIQITPETVGRVSPFHSPSGVTAVQALIANSRADNYQFDLAVDRYLDLTNEDCPNPDLTLGRASVLHGLTLLLPAATPEKAALLRHRGNELSANLMDLIASASAVGESPQISYLGVAHGWAGLLYALLRWSQAATANTPVTIERRLCELADRSQLTRRGARWPLQAQSTSMSLPGWCNGSAGYVHLWTLAHRIYRESRYLDLAERAAMDTFEGTGGGNALCCGFAGQAYAQLSLYQHTGDRRWRDQARKLTEKACALANAMPGRRAEYLPHSLYKGDMGIAVLVAEMENPETAFMPFFGREP